MGKGLFSFTSVTAVGVWSSAATAAVRERGGVARIYPFARSDVKSMAH